MAASKLEAITCPLCNTFSSKRITSLDQHFVDVHKTTSKNAWDTLFKGPVKCACGCGGQTRWINWKHGYSSMINGHNGSIYSIHNDEDAKAISEKRRNSLKGKPSWAKGLTKETDDRIAARAALTSSGRKKAFDEGTIVAWNKGLTKETDERVKIAAAMVKLDFDSGNRIAWHKGKLATTDERLQKKGETFHNNVVAGTYGQFPWHKGKTIKEEPRLKKLWANRNPESEYAHVRWSNDEIKSLLASCINLSLDDIESYKNDRTPALNVHCRTCEWTAKVSLIFARADRCPKCHPLGSNGQHELHSWICSAGVAAGNNVNGILGRQEIDIYVPARKLAIEFNGLYYHNEQAGKNRRYHQGKSDKCNELGISLFHVFEDEWKLQNNIIKSMLLHRLNLTPSKTSARKCSIVNLSKEEKKSFFQQNHIDSDAQSTAAFGLKKGETIVAAMSLRNKFHGKKVDNSIEIARFCCATNTHVAGALARLTTRAKIHAKEQGAVKLTTYVDTRFGGTGEGYKKSGFKLIGETDVRFWWTDNHKRFNRLKFKADKANGLTEAQVAENAGVSKIFGCKNLIYELKI